MYGGIHQDDPEAPPKKSLRKSIEKVEKVHFRVRGTDSNKKRKLLGALVEMKTSKGMYSEMSRLIVRGSDAKFRVRDVCQKRQRLDFCSVHPILYWW